MSDTLAGKLRRQIYGKKIVGYIMLGAIGLVFVFTGFGGTALNFGVGTVARVNDSMITAAELQRQENQIVEYYQNMFGGSIDLSSQRQMLRQQALRNLIDAEVISQAAAKAGILATDSEVRSVILSIPAFQDNGQFQRERYMGYLEAVRSSPSDFERTLRKDIQRQRTQQLFRAASVPMTLEVAKNKELAENQVNLAFVKLDVDALGQGAKVSEADARAKLGEEEFKIRAEQHFNDFKMEWSKPETVTAQHILIAAKAGDADAEKKALAKITELKTRAAKEDFGKLAAQFSEDPGSKANNGRLEAFGRGAMVPEFEEAAFGLPAGQVSAPVKTQFGYHLIKVLQKNEAVNPSFKDVEVKVATKLIARDRVEERLVAVEKAVGAGDLPATEKALSELGVKWEETGFFNLADQGVPKLPPGPVSEASAELSEGAPLLKRLVRDGGGRFILKFVGHRNEPVKNPEVVSADSLQQRRSAETFQSWISASSKKFKIETNAEVLKQ